MSSFVQGPVVQLSIDVAGFESQISRVLASTRQSLATANQEMARTFASAAGQGGASAGLTDAAKLRAGIAAQEISAAKQIVAERQRLAGVLQQEIAALTAKENLSARELGSLRRVTAELERQRSALRPGANIFGPGITAGTELALGGVSASITQAIQRAVAFIGPSLGGIAGGSQALGGLTQALGAVAAGAGGAVGSLAALATVVAATAGGLAFLAKQGGALAERLDFISQKTGISVKTLQLLEIIGKTTDVTLEDLVVAFRKFSQAVTGGGAGEGAGFEGATKKASQTLAALGVTSKDPEVALRQLFDVMSKLPAGFQKSTAAAELMGRTGLNLIPFFNKTGAEIKELEKILADFGGTVDARVIKQQQEWRLATVKLDLEIQHLKLDLAKDLLPTITEYANVISNAAGNTLEFFGAFRGARAGQIADNVNTLLKATGQQFTEFGRTQAVKIFGGKDLLKGGKDFLEQPEAALKLLRGLLTDSGKDVNKFFEAFGAGAGTAAQRLDAMLTAVQANLAKIQATPTSPELLERTRTLALRAATTLGGELLKIDKQLESEKAAIRRKLTEDSFKLTAGDVAELNKQLGLLDRIAAQDRILVRAKMAEQLIAIENRVALIGLGPLATLAARASQEIEAINLRLIQLRSQPGGLKKQDAAEVGILEREKTAITLGAAKERAESVAQITREGNAAILHAQAQTALGVTRIELEHRAAVTQLVNEEFQLNKGLQEQILKQTNARTAAQLLPERERQKALAEIEQDELNLAAAVEGKRVALTAKGVAEQIGLEFQLRETRRRIAEDTLRLHEQAAIAELPAAQRASAQLIADARHRQREIENLAKGGEFGPFGSLESNRIASQRITDVWREAAAKMRDDLASELSSFFDDIVEGNLAKRIEKNIRHFFFEQLANAIVGARQGAGPLSGAFGDILRVVLGLPNLAGPGVPAGRGGFGLPGIGPGGTAQTFPGRPTLGAAPSGPIQAAKAVVNAAQAAVEGVREIIIQATSARFTQATQVGIENATAATLNAGQVTSPLMNVTAGVVNIAGGQKGASQNQIFDSIGKLLGILSGGKVGGSEKGAVVAASFREPGTDVLDRVKAAGGIGPLDRLLGKISGSLAKFADLIGGGLTLISGIVQKNANQILTGGGLLGGAALARLGHAGAGTVVAGAGLAAGGLAQGGLSGALQTAAGGALIGLQFGGPVGAAIGAGIGALISGIRAFFGHKDRQKEYEEAVKKAIEAQTIKLPDPFKFEFASTPNFGDVFSSGFAPGAGGRFTSFRTPPGIFGGLNLGSAAAPLFSSGQQELLRRFAAPEVFAGQQELTRLASSAPTAPRIAFTNFLTFHVQALDSSGVDAVLAKHGRRFTGLIHSQLGATSSGLATRVRDAVNLA